MTGDDLDRAMTEDGDLVPSSGFVSSVMSAVLAEAAAPPPIPFPWARALAGAIAGIAVLLVVPVLWFFRSAQTVVNGNASSEIGRQFFDLVMRLGSNRDLMWTAGALVLTYFLIEVPRRLIARG